VAQIDPAAYTRYEGKYQFVDYPDYGVAIVREDDRLFLEETPDGMRYELYPESDTTFFCCERWEQITFVTGAAGTVEAMMFGEHERLERVD
jgi:hypothetical protein